MYAEVALFDDQNNADLTSDVLITLSLSPASSLSGTTTCTTVSGTCTFNNNFQSRYAGTYTLKATATGYTDATSTSFTVTGTAAFSSVTVSHTQSTLTAYFDISITVTIKDSANVQTYNPCSVTLTETVNNVIYGDSSGTITGTGSLNIYFTTAGSKTVQATCQGYQGTENISINFLILVVDFPNTTVFYM